MEGSAAQAPGKTVLRVVAISGSLRRASANTGLIRAATEICRESIPGLEVEHVDISELPLLNTDLEGPGPGAFPAAVEAFRGKVRAADCFLFASPEYNYSISGPLKNALDWGSRPPNCWGDRAAAILSASGGSGGSRSQYHVRQVGVFLDLHFVNKPEVFTRAHQPPSKFDDDGNLVDPDTKDQVTKVLLALQALALRLHLGKLAVAAHSS